MREFTLEYKQFLGIVKSQSKPPITSFKKLVNWRTDLRLGGLVNRLGVRNLLVSGVYYTPAVSVDGFEFVDFGDLKSMVQLGQSSIIINGFEFQGTFFPQDFKLTDTYSAPIAAISGSTIQVTTIPSTFSWIYEYTIVRNVSKIPHEYAVVKSVGSPLFTLTLNRAPSWNVGDVLIFYRSELQASQPDATYGLGLTFPYTIVTRPQFVNVGGKNDSTIVGVLDNLRNKNPWVGRIANRSYFGTGTSSFSFDGVYATGLMDDFSYGAFQRTQQHIQVKTSAPPTVNVRLDPNADVSTAGWTPHGAGTVFATLADGDTPDDTTYSDKSASVASMTIGFTALQTSADINGSIQIKTRLSTNAGQSMWVNLQITDPNGLTITLYAPQVISGTTWIPVNFTLPLDKTYLINLFGVPFGKFDFNLSALQIKLNFIHLLGAVNFRISYLEVYVPALSYQPIALTADSNYTLSFSELFDGFNETTLIYNKPYGLVKTDPVASYVDSNSVSIPKANTNVVITIKISTPFGELINRRVTSLKIYAAKTLTGIEQVDPKNLVWRLCKEISLDSSSWTFSNGIYSTEIIIGNEINGGILYTDRTGQSATESLIKKSYYGTSLSGRLFARNDVDTQVIYYSPVNANGEAQSSLPDSTFFVLSKTAGKIVGVFSLNDRLLIFKQFSTYVVNIEGLPAAVKDDFVSEEVGLASLASVAIGNRFLYFNSYTGIHQTDGFKQILINRDWIEEYRSYPVSALESAVGFYDSFSDSYYIFINSILWAYDTKTAQWRQEDFSHLGNALPAFNAKTFSGQTVYVGKNDPTQVYEFPRGDGLYKDTISLIDYAVDCPFETNDYESDAGMDEVAYINNGYCKNEGLTGVNTLDLQIKSSSVILKDVSITDEMIFPVSTKQPAVRISLVGDVLATTKIVIKEIGLYMKSLKRVGSTKVIS